jgi:hypothetical protein
LPSDAAANPQGIADRPARHSSANADPGINFTFAQGQAMSVIGMLLHAADSVERERHYNEGEVRDLRLTIGALKRLEKSRLKRRNGDLKKILLRGVKASATLERREMEATLSAFVTALALGKLDAALSKVVKGWLRRHLARQGEFLGNNVPS